MTTARTLAVLTALCLLAALLAGCPPKAQTDEGMIGDAAVSMEGEDAQAAGETKDTYEFALVPKLLDNPVFKLAEQGAQARAEELGDTKVVYQASQIADTAKQVEIIDTLIRKNVDGLSVSCNEAGALKAAIDRAIDAGIPTITFDSDSPDSKRITYYGVDNPKAGATCAELLVEALGDALEGEVAIITGVPGAPNLEERIQGVKDYLAENAPGLEILPPMPCNDDTQKGVNVVKDVLRAHPKLAGIIMVGGWPLFARAPGAFEGLEPGKVKVIGFDALPNEWDYVRQGYVQALVAQRCFAWGEESMQILHDIVADGKEFADFVDSGLDIVDESNVEEYAADYMKLMGEE